MNTLQEDLVSIVMRTTGDRIHEISRALSSIAANCYRPLEVIVVYQGVDNECLSFLAEQKSLLADIPMRLLHNPTTEDRRAENLNLGMSAAAGRFIGFLDDDDSIEPNHVDTLLKALRQSDRTWAYSQTILKKEDETFSILSESQPFRRKSFSLRALWEENFIPLHSFIIDRHHLTHELNQRPFCEELSRSEDWDFLIRLAYYHEPAIVDIATCNYFIATNGRNTNTSLINASSDLELEKKNRETWERCKQIVEQRKFELLAKTWWAREFFLKNNEGENGFVAPPKRSALGFEWGPLRRKLLLSIIRRLERLI